MGVRGFVRCVFLMFALCFILRETFCVEINETGFECSYNLDREDEEVIGQFINLSCVNKNKTMFGFSSGLNQSSIAWYRYDSGEAELVEYDQWFMSKKDNGVTFICAEDSNADELEVLCHVTPLEIYPTVKVERSHLQNKGTAIFVCDADGIPSIVEYNWYINGVDVDSYNTENSKVGTTEDDIREIILHSETVMELTGLKSKDRGTIVKCEAMTSTGLRASAQMVLDLEPAKSSRGGLTSDKMFLFGFIFAGGVPIIFAVVAGACWVVRRHKDAPRERTLTLEDEDLDPSLKKVDSLPRSIASGVTSDIPPNAVLYRTHSIRSTKDKVGPMSQLVLPPINPESNRVSQHIYDEAPNFATSELALSRGKHSSTLPARTYTSRSSLYRMSADYADVPLQSTSMNYENVSINRANGLPLVAVHDINRHPTSTLPAMRM